MLGRRLKYAGLMMAALFIMLSPLLSCSPLQPEPTREQILEAVMKFNGEQAEPLELVYEEMEIPHRYPGNAGAVLWVPDKSVQGNYRVMYDRREKAFYVKSCTRLILNEDGVYRNE